MLRKPGDKHNPATLNGFFNYGANKPDHTKAQVDEMSNQIRNLKKSLGELQSKIKAYQDIILKYESIFREEILLYRLQKSKLTTVQEAFHDQELFTREIEQHITSYISNPPKKKHDLSSFRRIILRFFHQNKINRCDTHSRISEIENLINQKQQLLEKFQTDVENWKKNLSLPMAASEHQPITLN